MNKQLLGMNGKRIKVEWHEEEFYHAYAKHYHVTHRATKNTQILNLAPVDKRFTLPIKIGDVLRFAFGRWRECVKVIRVVKEDKKTKLITVEVCRAWSRVAPKEVPEGSFVLVAIQDRSRI